MIEMGPAASRVQKNAPDHTKAPASRAHSKRFARFIAMERALVATWPALQQLNMRHDFVQPVSAAALGLEGRMQQFLREHVLPLRDAQGFSNFALDKLLAAIGDWANIGTRVRWPYRSIPQTEATRLRPVAHACLPELFQEGTSK